MTNHDYHKLPAEDEEEKIIGTTNNKDEEDIVVVDGYGTDEKDNDADGMNKPSSKAAVIAVRNRRLCGISCCCLCKCAMITVAVLSLLMVLAFTYTYLWMKDVVVHMTVPDSKDLPTVVPLSDAQADVFKDRINLFVDELRSRDITPKDDLVITQDEINGMLARSDYLRGHLVVTLTPGSIQEEFSLPTDMLPGGTGRYFAGTDLVELKQEDDNESTTKKDTKNIFEAQLETTATHEDWFTGPLFFVRLQYLVNNDDERTYYSERLLELYLQSGSSFFGQDVPPEVIDEHKNLLEGLYNDPDCGKDVRAIVDGIETVSIDMGRIVIRPRRRDHRGGDDRPPFHHHPHPKGKDAGSDSSSSSSDSSRSSSSSSDSGSSSSDNNEGLVTKSSLRRGTTSP